LPWDEVGYFAAKVGTNIAGTLPLIGNGIKEFILGGPEMGQLTLSRFFIMHVAILPFILLTFIIIHLVAFRQFGSVGPWKKARSLISGPFWPDQVFKDLVVSLIVMQLLIILSVYIRAPFAGPADPLDTSYHPKPEWNFLFLYQALKAFKGAWEPIGTILFPLFLIIFLASVPFLDRYKERDPLKRPIILIIGIVFFAGIIILTIEGKGKVPEIDVVSPSQKKIQISENVPANIKEGQDLFISNNCGLCHSINGAGGAVGPDLSHETAKGLTAQKIENQIKNPKNNNPQSVMPLFTNLTQEQLEDLANYLLNVDKGISKVAKSDLSASQYVLMKQEFASGQLSSTVQQTNLAARNVTGLAASIIGNPQHGRILFRQQCEGCHGIDGTGGVPNPGSTTGFIPTLKPISEKYFSNTVAIFVNNIDTIIQHGSVTEGNAKAFRMLGFGDANTISQQQIAQIESFILSLNKVDRAMILKPGIKPTSFVWISTGAILILTMIFLYYGFILKRRMKNRINYH
jgi:mono/diheme cytochrome c family protein